MSALNVKDNSCLVACDGLYADITDDYLQQKTIKGVFFLGNFIMKSLSHVLLGFHSLIGGVKSNAWESDADRHKFRQLFSGSADRKEDGLESLVKLYMSYKESYVKHIIFDPKEPNLSMYASLKEQKFTLFSYDVGARST